MIKKIIILGVLMCLVFASFAGVQGSKRGSRESGPEGIDALVNVRIVPGSGTQVFNLWNEASQQAPTTDITYHIQLTADAVLMFMGFDPEAPGGHDWFQVGYIQGPFIGDLSITLKSDILDIHNIQLYVYPGFTYGVLYIPGASWTGDPLQNDNHE